MIDVETTLPALVWESLGRAETREALAWKSPEGWVHTSGGAFLAMVSEIALGLHGLGVGAGDKVAIHSENRTEWLAADLAIVSLGAASVPIYTTQPPEQIRYILQHAEAKALFLSGPAMAATSREPAGALGIDVIAFDGLPDLGPHEMSLETLREQGRARATQEPGLHERLRAERQPSEIAALIYTSGTTGTPKGVLLTHANLAHSIGVALKGSFIADLGGREGKLLSFLPFAHIFEHTCAYGFLCSGHPLYILPTVDTLVDDLAEVRPLHFTTVPRLLERVYGGIKSKAAQETGIKGRLMRWAVGLADDYDLAKGPTWQHRIADRLVFSKMRARLGGNLVGITSGGAALSAEIAKFFIAIGVPVGEGYGLTETAPVISIYDVNDLRPGSIGKAVEDVEVRLGADDELIVRGPNVMQGYYKEPEETAAVLTEDGWFHTGDIARIDDEGFLYIIDRKKELFKLSTGKYVAPAQIENRLIASPLIEQVVVVGNGRKFCSALIVPDAAAVGARFDHEPSPAEIEGEIAKEVDAANEGLPVWETVKRFEITREPMTIESGELTPTMKRKRRVIDERRKAAIDAIYGQPAV